MAAAAATTIHRELHVLHTHGAMPQKHRRDVNAFRDTGVRNRIRLCRFLFRFPMAWHSLFVVASCPGAALQHFSSTACDPFSMTHRVRFFPHTHGTSQTNTEIQRHMNALRDTEKINRTKPGYRSAASSLSCTSLFVAARRSNTARSLRVTPAKR